MDKNSETSSPEVLLVLVSQVQCLIKPLEKLKSPALKNANHTHEDFSRRGWTASASREESFGQVEIGDFAGRICCSCRGYFCPGPKRRSSVPEIHPANCQVKAESRHETEKPQNASLLLRLIENETKCELGTLASGHVISGRGALKAMSRKRA